MNKQLWRQQLPVVHLKNEATAATYLQPMNLKSRSPKFGAIIAGLIFVSPIARAQDAKFFADNLKYSRDFYSKVHFVAIAELPHAFKYDRYPADGPERIQCDEGTYTRQHSNALGLYK